MRGSQNNPKSINIVGSQFLLNIRYQQHNDWQGQIQRLDSGETINFRSTLELLTLIEAALESRRKPEEEKRFRSWSLKRGVDACSNCSSTGAE